MIRTFTTRIALAASLLVMAAAGLLATRLSAEELAPARRAPGHGILGRMARHVDLTDDQKDRIRGVIDSHKAAREGQREARRAAWRALREATAAQPRDETAIRARAAEVGRVMGDDAVMRARLRSEIAPILTDAQREKLREMRERFGERRGRRGGRL